MIVQACLQADIDQAYANLNELLREGYSPVDVITTLFRVIKTYPMPEHAKLEFIRVRLPAPGARALFNVWRYPDGIGVDPRSTFERKTLRNSRRSA